MPRNSEETVFDALAHSSRRRILRYLRCKHYVRASDTAHVLGIGPSTRSGHLKVLRHASLLTSRRAGTELQYRTNPSALDHAISMLCNLRTPTTETSGFRTTNAATGPKRNFDDEHIAVDARSSSESSEGGPVEDDARHFHSALNSDSPYRVSGPS
ncbi:hypothetical protein CIK58_17155 [Brevibacterium aurantiacum]|uniref:ArsR/SmtB family transcription factor n=1 Tax=Brevibacterium aurantiacum TaxID=273384 RepID=UPI000BB6B63A|nr:hypothetical protein CIK58_17155 [Brevibacterium aurantiacum]